MRLMNNCKSCAFLVVRAERNNLKPYCYQNILKFKSREKIDWEKHEDVSTKVCGTFSSLSKIR